MNWVRKSQDIQEPEKGCEQRPMIDAGLGSQLWSVCCHVASMVIILVGCDTRIDL